MGQTGSEQKKVERLLRHSMRGRGQRKFRRAHHSCDVRACSRSLLDRATVSSDGGSFVGYFLAICLRFEGTTHSHLNASASAREFTDACARISRCRAASSGAVDPAVHASHSTRRTVSENDWSLVLAARCSMASDQCSCDRQPFVRAIYCVPNSLAINSCDDSGCSRTLTDSRADSPVGWLRSILDVQDLSIRRCGASCCQHQILSHRVTTSR